MCLKPFNPFNLILQSILVHFIDIQNYNYFIIYSYINTILKHDIKMYYIIL